MSRIDEYVLIKYRGALEPIAVTAQQAAEAIGAGLAVPVTWESRPDLVTQRK
jgi:hypothetical protein